ncbi:hypothetical protein [Bdellovibrio sp. HCB209]|uniref:hypothetical protein n=1 Tax=Bdellovibrio sp. HCB209 TaxID=3394354 RepID=UPI0039B47F7B
MKYKYVVGVIATLCLSACVEIRDKEEEQEVLVYSASNITIDEPYVLVDGDLIPVRSLSQNVRHLYVDSQKPFEVHLDNLTFKPGGVIYTMGYNVSFNVGNMITQGGLITSFPEGHQAQGGADGVGGGRLELNIQHARGELKVIMVGESGANGLSGNAPDEALQAKPNPAMICNKGLPGYPGGNGTSGGSSGTLEISVEDDSNFELSVKVQSGRGGLPGKGGQGGNPFPYNGCFPQHIGMQGPDGAAGKEGALEPHCVKLGDRERICKYK